MRRFMLIYASFVMFFGVTSAQASVQIDIDLSRQSMHVESSGGAYNWPISSARAGYFTPDGNFAPTHIELMHHSKKYDNAPMPHAIFFSGGFAIHGTYETRELGRPASHGCVRISPANATLLYALVKAEGASISIHGSPPPSHPFAYASTHHHRRHLAGDGTSAPVHTSAATVFGFGGGDPTSPLFH